MIGLLLEQYGHGLARIEEDSKNVVNSGDSV